MAPQRTQRIEHSFGQLRYLLHVPDADAGVTSGRWPLILFLHGATERGNHIEEVKRHGIPKVVEREPSFPFIAVSPQCPRHRWWTELTPLLRALLEELLGYLPVDRQRVYVTGLSMGGFGTWKLAAEAPEMFAAVAPICGGGDPRWAPRLAKLPVWAFHGTADHIVPMHHSVRMVTALRALDAPVKLTLYEGVGHDSWTQTYDNPAFYNWLLAHHGPEPCERAAHAP